MPRKDPNLQCLFCGEAPCVCNKPAKDKPKRKAKSEARPPIAPSETSDSFDAVPERVNRFKHKTVVKPRRDMDLDTALRNLKDANLLDPETVKELETEGLLARRISRDTLNRLADWRSKRASMGHS